MKIKTMIAITIAASCSILSISAAPVSAKHVKHSSARRHIYKGSISQSVAAADRLLLKGKYADAATRYEAALKRNPNDINAAVGLGMAQGRQFKLDAAEKQFDKVLGRDPGNPGAHAGKAMVMLNRLNSSSTTIRKNRDSILKEAESESQKALSEDPQIPEAHYTMGMVYKEQGRLSEAASQFQQAVSIDPGYADGYSGLGMVKLAQNNPGSAISDFKQAIRLNSGDYTAHYGLGEALRSTGQIDAALKELNTALYQFPNSWPVHLSLGRAYETQGNGVAAVREYQESIRIKPENSAAYLGIANIREARGDIELSIGELRSGLELMPDNADLRLRIGDQSLRLEKVDDAIKEYQTIMTAQPGNARAADGLTTAYYLKAQKETKGGFFGDNDYDEALQMIDRAVQLNPNDLRLRLAQAKLKALAGDPVDLNSIGQPTNDGERVSYAQALLAQNRFQEAAQQMNTVLAHSNNAKQTFALADLSLMVRDLDTAEAAYRKASLMPGSAERARRGLANVGKAREEARQHLTLADDLSKKRMTGSAIDTYHQAIFSNPKVPGARLGIARALETVSRPTPVQLREAAMQYRAYVALVPGMPPKEQEKYEKKAAKLDVKAGKIEQKSISNR